MDKIPAELVLQIIKRCDSVLDVVAACNACVPWRRIVQYHDSTLFQPQDHLIHCSRCVSAPVINPSYGPWLNYRLRQLLAAEAMTQDTSVDESQCIDLDGPFRDRLLLNGDIVEFSTAVSCDSRIPVLKSTIYFDYDGEGMAMINLNSGLVKTIKDRKFLTETHDTEMSMFQFYMLENDKYTTFRFPPGIASFQQAEILYLSSSSMIVRSARVAAADEGRVVAYLGVATEMSGGAHELVPQRALDYHCNIILNHDVYAIIDGHKIYLYDRNSNSQIGYHHSNINDPWYLSLDPMRKARTLFLTNTHLLYYNRQLRILKACPIENLLINRELLWKNVARLNVNAQFHFTCGSCVVNDNHILLKSTTSSHVCLIDLLHRYPVRIFKLKEKFANSASTPSRGFISVDANSNLYHFTEWFCLQKAHTEKEKRN